MQGYSHLISDVLSWLWMGGVYREAALTSPHYLIEYVVGIIVSSIYSVHHMLGTTHLLGTVHNVASKHVQSLR